MLEWYIPWDQIDWGLKAQILIWFAAILSSYWICWRTLIRKRPWLRSGVRQHDAAQNGGPGLDAGGGPAAGATDRSGVSKGSAPAASGDPS